METVLELLGLGVAKCTLREGGVLDVAYYGAGAEREEAPFVRRLALRAGDGAIGFPGRCALLAPDGRSFDLDVVSTGEYGFALTATRGGRLLASGLGLRDPDDGASLMVSWWTGETEPYGVVKYSIRDARTIEGYYISKMSPDLPGCDIATGDTGGGLPGDYVLNSREVNGRIWGPHEWMLSQRGEVVDLAWREHGRIFCRGLGIIDPADPKSTIATYVAL